MNTNANIEKNITCGQNVRPIRQDVDFSSSMADRVSLFLAGKIAKIFDQIELFWFVNPPKSNLLIPRRQTLESRVTLPELHEAATLSEFFLIKKQSIGILDNIMSQSNG
jgi:hypothetical protein